MVVVADAVAVLATVLATENIETGDRHREGQKERETERKRVRQRAKDGIKSIDRSIDLITARRIEGRWWRCVALLQPLTERTNEISQWIRPLHLTHEKSMWLLFDFYWEGGEWDGGWGVGEGREPVMHSRQATPTAPLAPPTPPLAPSPSGDDGDDDGDDGDDDATE